MDIPIDKIRDFCVTEGISYLAIFGSVAGGNERPDSDIDILVSFHDESKIGLLHFIGVKNRLADLLGRPVDLVDRAGLNPRIKPFVLASLREIYNDAA